MSETPSNNPLSSIPAPSRSQGEPFLLNEQLLQPNLTVPLPLIVNSKRGFQAVLRDLLIRCKVNRITVEPCANTVGSMVFGCQEFVAGCQDLIASEEAAGMIQACNRILTGCREISGNLEGSYVLLQATDGMDVDEEDSMAQLNCARLKDLSAHLEQRFVSSEITLHMDLQRLGILEVHLDEVFDECTRQLERFYFLVQHKNSRVHFVQFARKFYDDLFKRIVPDHIFDPVKNASPGGDARTGLLDLLPELQDSVREKS